MDFAVGVNNNLMDGYFGLMFLVGIFIVAFLGLLVATNDVRSSAGGASWALLICGILFRAIGLIENRPLFIIILLCAGAIAVCSNKN